MNINGREINHIIFILNFFLIRNSLIFNKKIAIKSGENIISINKNTPRLLSVSIIGIIKKPIGIEEVANIIYHIEIIQ